MRQLIWVAPAEGNPTAVKRENPLATSVRSIYAQSSEAGDAHSLEFDAIASKCPVLAVRGDSVFLIEAKNWGAKRDLSNNE